MPGEMQRGWTGAALEVLESAWRRSARYLGELPQRAVAPSPAALAALRRLDAPLPADGHAPADTLALLDELVSPATMAMVGPRFFGFVTGGSLPAALAANWLAGSWDQNAAFYSATPGVAHLEQVALRWLLELLDLPRESGAGFVTGATLANFTALAAARHAVLARAGWNVEADGLFGAPPITVIAGAEAHPSVLKALGMLGLGRARIVRVPVDAQGRMRAEALPAIAGPSIVCVQAGNVNTGACDPLAQLVPQARASGAWVHVDGAFGLWARVSPRHRALTLGIEQADSWATDAHKWLNVPYDSGVALVRDPGALTAAMAVSADYLPAAAGSERAPCDYTPELSRRARGIEIWAALHSLGQRGMVELVERNCAQAREFAVRLAAAGYQVLNHVVLNQVLVSFGDAARTRAVVAALQREGTCWCGVTLWQGHTAMRISVSNWSTQDEDVERSIAAMLQAAAG
ncbi:MAG TPA: aminotransferase class V-fold PLP-dependent enzyme [Steroidobacteraceae bacterium]